MRTFDMSRSTSVMSLSEKKLGSSSRDMVMSSASSRAGNSDKKYNYY
jgi:hypothetical protein